MISLFNIDICCCFLFVPVLFLEFGDVNIFRESLMFKAVRNQMVSMLNPRDISWDEPVNYPRRH